VRGAAAAAPHCIAVYRRKAHRRPPFGIYNGRIEIVVIVVVDSRGAASIHHYKLQTTIRYRVRVGGRGALK